MVMMATTTTKTRGNDNNDGRLSFFVLKKLEVSVIYIEESLQTNNPFHAFNFFLIET